MNECSLGVHEVELVVETSPSVYDGGGVGQHAHRSAGFSHITAGGNGGLLVVDTNLSER